MKIQYIILSTAGQNYNTGCSNIFMNRDKFQIVSSDSNCLHVSSGD